MNATLDQLSDQFGIAGAVQFDDDKNGLTRVKVCNAFCRGSAFLHGAHVCSYCPHGADELFFVSRNSQFQNDKPIRGGVPICFPWFGSKSGDDQAPSHGFARLMNWTFMEVLNDGEGTRLVFGVELDPFDVRYSVSFGSALTMSLEIANRSSSSQTFEAALHSYFRLQNARTARITGLEDSRFTDQLQAAEHDATGQPIRFEEETDRIYHDNSSVIGLHDTDAGRKIMIDRQGSSSVVVWNPWIEKSKRMEDFGDDEWPSMCCIETANVRGSAIMVEPKQKHAMSAIHRLESV